MTYFGFLLLFLVGPIMVLAVLTVVDWRRAKTLPPALRAWPAGLALLVHIVVALVYTTPWDNYLVATQVWWYDPGLVTGIVLGWVPLEEYTFFVLQPVLAGLWLLYLARRLPASEGPVRERPGLRRFLPGLLGVFWLAALLILLGGWSPGVYLSLILIWALPPIMLQVWFGADILWHYRRLVLGTVLPVFLYLSLADAVAIRSGTWTIDPAQSLQLYLGNVLPIEEFIFFLVTTTLLVQGMTLLLARTSQERIRPFLSHSWPCWLRNCMADQT